MSACNKSLTINRIAAATSHSPLAVFAMDREYTRGAERPFLFDTYHVVFASTVKSQREINGGRGVYEDTRSMGRCGACLSLKAVCEKHRFGVELIGVYWSPAGEDTFKADVE